jgi:hypothetical protein
MVTSGQVTNEPAPLGVAQRRVNGLADQGVAEQRDVAPLGVFHQGLLAS